ncbi:MAG: class F sortase, partial [Acidimicrobiales bacterium]
PSGIASLAVGASLLGAGAAALGLGAAAQRHAPQPAAAQAGALGGPAGALGGPAPPSTGAEVGSSRPLVPATLDMLAAALGSRQRGTTGPVLAKSRPVALDIPAIGVDARVGEVGLNPNGTIQVPPLFSSPNQAAWYRYSPTPGQVGPSVIVGHVDNVDGPAVFFRLGALAPGDKVEVTLADATVATFVVDGVRSYPKTRFPTAAVYGPTDHAALRLVTCGGPFSYSTRQYADNTVVFASLVSPREVRGGARRAAA